MIRRSYVSSVRVLRTLTERLRLLPVLEGSRSPSLRHVRTMLAIHDARDLAALDLPWWTYGATLSVERFLAERENARVFEYGSGASSVFLARRVGQLETVEHDVRFAPVVRELLGDSRHARLREVPPEPLTTGEAAARSSRRGWASLDFSRYVATIDEVDGEFDLIVIDGRARVDCLERAVEHLAPGGLILFDDSGRRRYRRALANRRLRCQHLRGLRPGLFYPTSTALLTLAEDASGGATTRTSSHA